MFRKVLCGLIAMVICGVFVVSSFAQTEDPALQAKVKEAIAQLQAKAEALGAAKVEGTEPLGDKVVPVLYFGSTKINQNYAIVDELKATFGCTATFFVAYGSEYLRISTNVMKEGNRAIGTNLDPAGKAFGAIAQGQSFFGIVNILGKPYQTGYVPIKNAAGETVGIYYVGYALQQ